MNFGFHILTIATQFFGDASQDAADELKEKETDLALCTVDSKKLPLRGIAIVTNSSQLDEKSLGNGIYVDKRVHLPGSIKTLQNCLEPFLNQEINQENLIAVRQEITNYYCQNGHPLVNVEIPEQDISLGVVSFVVTEICLGEICYTGNRWFSEEKVARKLHLQPGECICKNDLLNDVAWLNKNPFHFTEVILSPGKNNGQSDLEVVTKDRFPLRVFVGADNTGVESTGKGRFYAGLTWGNAFFADDLLTYQFTTNSTYDKFHSHTLYYNSFLPWKHQCAIYGGYAQIHPDIKSFRSEGKDAQASLRYRIPFKPFYTNFIHEIYFGFDYKYITSALFFVGELDPTSTPVTNSIANVSQEMIGYRFEHSLSQHELTFQTEIFGSPAEWLPHQSLEAYSSLRPNAKPRYIYGTLTFGDIYTFGTQDALSFLFRAQGSPNTLIPSEQFTLGGYSTVRGYEENVFISDNGVCVNLEARTRPFSLTKCKRETFSLLAFMDYGWGYNYHQFDGIKKAAVLWGVGPGLRCNISPYFNFRVDYGFKLHSIKFDDTGLGMWHIGAILEY